MFCTSKVDDEKQELSVTLTRVIRWHDSRIALNISHPHWILPSGQKRRKSIRLNEQYLENCLWMPSFMILGTKKMTSYRPLPTSLDNSPMSVTLDSDGSVTMTGIQLQVIVDCVMYFGQYPFDEQV